MRYLFEEEVKRRLKEFNITYRENDLYVLIDDIKEGIEDGSKFVFVTDGYEDLEMSIEGLEKYI